MFNLMEVGLQAQAQSIGKFYRIVSASEKMHDVLLEAIGHKAFVWVNAKTRKSVICTNKPDGDWEKVHAGETSHPCFSPEAA